MSVTDFIVKVKTSDRLGAGTDANVSLQLFGEAGVSEPLGLTKSQRPNKFERDQLDEFKLMKVQGVGKVEKIKVWHDNSGTAPAWHLEYVEICDTKLGQMFRFPCHKWIGGTGKDSPSCEAVIKCTETADGPKFIGQAALGVPNPNPARKLSLSNQMKEKFLSRDRTSPDDSD